MDVTVRRTTALRFADGAPVRAASAVVALAGGWLVAQDDAVHAAWWHDGVVARVRALPPVRGLETFEEAAGTKHLKPDLEAAFAVPDDPAAGGAADDGVGGGAGDVVLLGSGSSPARTRATRVGPPSDGREPVVQDLADLYDAVARALEVERDLLNLEGACVVGDALRWFHRGLPSAGVPTAGVDVDLADLLGAVAGRVAPGDVRVRDARRYDLGAVDGVGLAVTDAVTLPDGALLVSAAAEDTDDPRDDGPVVGSVLAVLRDGRVVASAPLPHLAGAVPKVEGLALVDAAPGRVRLLATVDADDTEAPSLAVELDARW